MTADPDLVVFGEDVGTLGGVLRVTDGSSEDFGQDRGWKATKDCSPQVEVVKGSR
jgi:pyruvate/2-oxoglutarate/acetoin dehydrogenase E1 component